jgi:saccharopine dehydrogenase (NAD+, L-lysine forming)
LGRSGKGAKKVFEMTGLDMKNLTIYTRTETSNPEKIKELINYDIIINCIYLDQKLNTPFMTFESLEHSKVKKIYKKKERKLSVIVDVSCDVGSTNNPFPIYKENTNFKNPTVRVFEKDNLPLDIISIDHLPTFIPREASELFSKELTPHLITLGSFDIRRIMNNNKQTNENQRVWERAKKLFLTRVDEIKNVL